jgi:hypothetical protein
VRVVLACRDESQSARFRRRKAFATFRRALVPLHLTRPAQMDEKHAQAMDFLQVRKKASLTPFFTERRLAAD